MPYSRKLIAARWLLAALPVLVLMAAIGCGGSKPEPAQTGNRLAQAGSAVKNEQVSSNAANPKSSSPVPPDESPARMPQDRTLDELFEQAGDKEGFKYLQNQLLNMKEKAKPENDQE